MNALVLVAHGSRRKASNEEVQALTNNIAKVLDQQYPIITTGFLELAEPLIPDAIENCIKQGANCVNIIPYFLSAGRHVHHDIPSEVAKAQQQYPDVSMTILPHIGGSEHMIALIKQAVTTSVSS